MKAPRPATLAAFVAAFFYLGGLTASAQTPAPEPAASTKPVMAPPAASKTASASRTASAKKTVSKDSVHVYLLRGLLNVFSLGMDELADKIRAAGIQASVHNHTEWEGIADQIAANYKAGNHAPIILIGHSLGADSVIYMSDYLGKRGVPVALVVPFDGTQTLVASSNVARVLNFTQRDYAFARRGAGFRGELQNVDVSSQGVDHLNIDKSERLHAMVVAKIVAVVKKGEVPAEFATLPGEREKETKPLPKPAPAEMAARPEPAHHEAEKPAEAVKPESNTEPKPSTIQPAAAPAAPRAAMPAAPAVSAAASTPASQPISAPQASAPQPVSTPAPTASPASAALPAGERLEYEKLVLPKR